MEFTKDEIEIFKNVIRDYEEFKKEINEIERALINFQSNTMERFLEENNKAICFDYNFEVIMDTIKDKLVVEVWEVE